MWSIKGRMLEEVFRLGVKIFNSRFLCIFHRQSTWEACKRRAPRGHLREQTWMGDDREYTYRTKSNLSKNIYKQVENVQQTNLRRHYIWSCESIVDEVVNCHQKVAVILNSGNRSGLFQPNDRWFQIVKMSQYVFVCTVESESVFLEFEKNLKHLLYYTSLVPNKQNIPFIQSDFECAQLGQ